MFALEWIKRKPVFRGCVMFLLKISLQSSTSAAVSLRDTLRKAQEERKCKVSEALMCWPRENVCSYQKMYLVLLCDARFPETFFSCSSLIYLPISFSSFKFSFFYHLTNVLFFKQHLMSTVYILLLQVCFDGEANMLFIPCGHICCCIGCARALKLCPTCRKTIKEVVPAYASWYIGLHRFWTISVW